MLVAPSRMQGVTLIELMIGLVVMAVLMSMGAGSFRSWIQNQQTRVAAESILNGLQLARGEAVKRNANAAFVLCSDLTTASPDSSWDVLATSASGVTVACSTVPSAGPTGWDRIQQRSGQEGSRNASIASIGSFNAVAFNGFGRVVTTPSLPAGFTQSITTVNVSNPQGDRSLRITVNPGGSVRMCDPNLAVGSSPQAC